MTWTPSPCRLKNISPELPTPPCLPYHCNGLVMMSSWLLKPDPPTPSQYIAPGLIPSLLLSLQDFSQKQVWQGPQDHPQV